MKKRQTRRLEVSFKKFKEITLELKVCGSFPTESKKNRKKNPGKTDWDRARQIALYLPERERCVFRVCLREGARAAL